MIIFSKLGFPVAHGRFLSPQYEDYIYKFIVDARAAARSEKKKTFSTISRVILINYFLYYTRV